MEEVKNDKGVFENGFNKILPTQKKFFLHHSGFSFAKLPQNYLW
jgi:hypothetical protein